MCKEIKAQMKGAKSHIPGVGKSIRARLFEFIQTVYENTSIPCIYARFENTLKTCLYKLKGKIKYLEELKRGVPTGATKLIRVPGMDCFCHY